MKILICGYGNIGKHIEQEFKLLSDSLFIYDKYQDAYHHAALLNNKYEYAFVCVPTESTPNGSCDLSQVKEAVSLIQSDLIIVKSTVSVGAMNDLQNQYNKNIVYSPEYYGTTIHAPHSPDFLILAGEQQNCNKAADLYHKIKPASFKIAFTNYKTAELAKYMENSFLALKVTFCSEFYTIANAFGISYNELREIFVLDERMGNSHTYIDPKQPFYNSHCLNKDIPGLLSCCKNAGIDAPLLKAMNEINLNFKDEYLNARPHH